MKKLSFLYILLTLQIVSFAQQRTTLPYSMFGIGELCPKGFVRNLGMGRTGIALSSSKFLNNVNPASYHSIDSISFFFDLGLSGDYVRYVSSENDNYQDGFDMNLRDIAFGFRINRKWAGSLGINPYSSVGYKVVTKKGIEGVEDGYFDVLMTGSGGLSQFYINNSYLISKNLSLGASLSYLFGSISSSENSSSSLLSSEIVSKKTSYLKRVTLDFGAQYFFSMNDRTKVTLGAIFGNSHKLNFEYNLSIYESNGTVIENETEGRTKFKTPLYFGGGVAFELNKKLTLSADYIYQDWSSNNGVYNKSKDPQESNVVNRYTKFDRTSSIRVGAEYIPENFDNLGYFGALSYRIGFYYQGSYIRIKDNQLTEKGMTLGVGFPFRQNLSSFNLSYNLGFVGNSDNNTIEESYNSFMISLTLHDWWFLKRKID
jgi:hypothetical protein